MTKLSDLMHSTRNKTTLPGQIKDITVFGSFHKGFLDLDLYYETLEVQLEVETKSETVYLKTNIKNFFDSPLSRLLSTQVQKDDKSLDLAELVGMDIYIAFCDNFKEATIGTDINVKYNPDSRFIKKQIVESEGTTEKRTIEYANEKLRNDFHIKSEGVDGWVQAKLSYIGEIAENYVFKAELETDTCLYWTFDTKISSLPDIKQFLENLGITYTTAEFDSEYIWVKPVTMVDHTNRKENRLMLDSEEKWTAREQPQSVGYTLFERILKKLKPSKSVSVSFEADTSKRIANTSDTRQSFKDMYSECDIESKKQVKDLNIA